MDIKKQLNIAGEGAKLVAKQAERMRVANVSLPGAYRKLGEEIFKTGVLQDKLGDVFAKIQTSIDDQKKLNEAGPAAEGFAEKMKAAAISAKNMAVSKKMEYDRGGMFSELGRLAFEGFKQELDGNFSTKDVSSEIEKLANLDQEIALLNSSGKDNYLNPKNVSIGFVAIIGIAIAFFGYKIIFGGKAKEPPVIAKNISNNSMSTGFETELNAIAKEKAKGDEAWEKSSKKLNEIVSLDNKISDLREKLGLKYPYETDDPEILESTKTLENLRNERKTLENERIKSRENLFTKIQNALDKYENEIDKSTQGTYFGTLIEHSIGFKKNPQAATDFALKAYRRGVTPICDGSVKVSFDGISVAQILEKAKIQFDNEKLKGQANLEKAENKLGSSNLEKKGELLGKIFATEMYMGMTDLELKDVVLSSVNLNPTKQNRKTVDGKQSLAIFYGDEVFFIFLKNIKTDKWGLASLSVNGKLYLPTK